MPSYQVTLTTANTTYSLLTLVRAIDPAFIDQSKPQDGGMWIQVDNDGGAQKILIGDANISSTRYGSKLVIGDRSNKYQSLAGVYAQSDTNAKKLNIDVVR